VCLDLEYKFTSLNRNKLDICSDRYFKQRSKDKTPTITDEGLLFWWAHQDLNLGPKDSGLCSFHYSLDYAFIILIAQLRWVPSSLYTFNSTFTLKLGSALACAAFDCI
jgi:hypothetical protein